MLLRRRSSGTGRSFRRSRLRECCRWPFAPRSRLRDRRSRLRERRPRERSLLRERERGRRGLSGERELRARGGGGGGARPRERERERERREPSRLSGGGPSLRARLADSPLCATGFLPSEFLRFLWLRW